MTHIITGFALTFITCFMHLDCLSISLADCLPSAPPGMYSTERLRAATSFPTTWASSSTLRRGNLAMTSRRAPTAPAISQFFHREAKEHGIEQLHHIPLGYCDTPPKGYLEIIESSFMTLGYTLVAGLKDSKGRFRRHWAVFEQVAGSHYRAAASSIVGANCELSVMRSALVQRSPECEHCDHQASLIDTEMAFHVHILNSCPEGIPPNTDVTETYGLLSPHGRQSLRFVNSRSPDSTRNQVKMTSIEFKAAQQY